MKIGRRRNFPRSHKLVIMAFMLVGFSLLGSYVYRTNFVGAAACTVPTTDNGTATLSMTIPATATYKIWTRMMVPDATNNKINIQVDNTDCYSVGGSTAITANTWTWVGYKDGNTASPITQNLTAGTHSIKYVGTNSGVLVDRIILASDLNCTPTGTGDDCASGDATPPTVSVTAPTANATVSNSVTLSANATDTSGIDKVEFLVDGTVVNTDTASPYTYSWNSTTVTNGSHTITARATDKAANVGTSSGVAVNVSNTLPCTGNPSTPTGLASSNVSYTQLTLGWAASTPASGCVLSGYNVYRDGTLIKTVTSGTSLTDTGLQLNRTYSYTVAATDSTGHVSAQSTALSVKTQADTTAPATPTGLSAPLITATQVGLTWTASSDNVSTAGYYIYRNGTQVGQSSTASYTDTSLAPNTTYSYTIKAFDASGNISAASTASSYKTLQGSNANLGDMNGDNKVDVFDLSILFSHWNQTGVPITQGDANGDGVVNIFDLSILFSHWGTL